MTIKVTFYNDNEKIIEPLPNTTIETGGYNVQIWLFESQSENLPIIKRIRSLFPDEDDIWVEVPPLYLNKYRTTALNDWSLHDPEEVRLYPERYPKHSTTVDRRLLMDWLSSGAPQRWGF